MSTKSNPSSSSGGIIDALTTAFIEVPVEVVVDAVTGGK